MKKSERLNLIKKMVLEQTIETQHDLLARLKEYGLELTQATISRDMNEIGIVKIPSENGRYIYGLSQDSGKKLVQRPASIRRTILTISEPMPGLDTHLFLQVIPGNAMVIKKYVTADFSDRLFAILADDDSILVIAKTAADCELIRQTVTKWKESVQ